MSPQIVSEENNRFIWIFWWQGYEDAHELVKKCISSIKENCPADKQVVVLDKDNYAQWLKIKPVIIRKVENETITLTHFSDIVRMGLLSRYGGLWVDATIYAGHLIPKSIWSRGFYSNSIPVVGDYFVSKGEWSGFLIGGCNRKLFSFCFAIFEQYWSEHDYLIDYFFLDYCIRLASVCFSDIHELIREPGNSDDIYKLQSIMNLPYEESVFKEIIDNNLFQKLNRKETFLMETPDKIKTTYAVWIE